MFGRSCRPGSGVISTVVDELLVDVGTIDVLVDELGAAAVVAGTSVVVVPMGVAAKIRTCSVDDRPSPSMNAWPPGLAPRKIVDITAKEPTQIRTSTHASRTFGSTR